MESIRKSYLMIKETEGLGPGGEVSPLLSPKE